MDKSILLVEDNPDDEELTLLALREYNLTNHIDVVRDGEEALDYMFARGEWASRNINNLPQLILLDINLPKVNGTEVLRQIRQDERTRFVPVVMLTTSREEQDLVKSYSYGANSYIVKPVDFAQFIEAVRSLEMYWLVLNQPVNGHP